LDFNLNFQVYVGCCPVGPRDGPNAVFLDRHEVFEDIVAGEGGSYKTIPSSRGMGNGRTDIGCVEKATGGEETFSN
jgi:hypothetical protein